MSTKAKVLISVGSDDLEVNINNWLREATFSKIVSVSHSEIETTTRNSSNPFMSRITSYTTVIIYEA